MSYQPEAGYASGYFTTLDRLLRATLVTLNDGSSLTFDSGIDKLVALCRGANAKGGRIFFVGNGGSAAIASHMTTDYFKNGKMTTMSLYDPAMMTCLSNDFGYEYVFAKQLEAHATPRDLVIAISSSGRSQNILNAVEAAKANDATVVTLSGFSSKNPLRKLGSINLYVPSSEYGYVELAHCSICHCVLDAHLNTPTDELALRPEPSMAAI